MSDAASPPTRILVPIDLSERSKVALSYAVMLARAFDATVVLMTNVHLDEERALQPFARSEGISTDAAAEAALQRYALGLGAGVRTETRTRFTAHAADAILDVVTAEGVDMVVIASHGRGGMSRWLLGSVAEKVARAADVPVVIVPTRGNEATAKRAG